MNIFLCGPEEMIFNVKEALNIKGVEDKKFILNFSILTDCM